MMQNPITIHTKIQFDGIMYTVHLGFIIKHCIIMMMCRQIERLNAVYKLNIENGNVMVLLNIEQ